MSKIIKVTTDDAFKSEINKGIVVVNFWADWSGLCRTLEIEMKDLATKIEGVGRVIKVDVDSMYTILKKYNIHRVPTVLIFDEGKEVQRLRGMFSDKYMEEVNKIVGEKESTSDLVGSRSIYMERALYVRTYSGCRSSIRTQPIHTK